ncbi:BTB/POZ domain-containing protein NPY2 [Platanthera zijinensis]|uniref:BTB/POZ domain-containing protein NPY2 n=1 Tax=Platanthera zijinensis TaxID=2320716 RepID=A0AAP0B260_9ASPA
MDRRYLRDAGEHVGVVTKGLMESSHHHEGSPDSGIEQMQNLQCLQFPLLSKSSHLQKLVASATEENSDEIYIPDIPGGSDAFEICAKFCYGMIVTLNAYNVIAVHCAAEYLEMHETVEKGNLLYKIEVFLNTSIFRSWRDSIIVLQSTKSLLPWSEKSFKLVNHCIDSIALKASMDVSKVDWSYTYTRKRSISVPKDWWIEDLCELDFELFSRVLATVKAMKRVPPEVIGAALKHYTYNVTERGNMMKSEFLEAIVGLLPAEKGSVSCNFLLRLLRSSRMMHCGVAVERDLMKRIGRQLDEAHVSDLLFPVPGGESTDYDIEMVLSIVREYVRMERKIVIINGHDLVLDKVRIAVGKLVDGYLAEIAKNSHQSVDKFIELASILSAESRPVHDEIYHVIDLYLKVDSFTNAIFPRKIPTHDLKHPDLSKSERKKLCSLIDCKKLSPDAISHAVQNESLPLRLVVQVLFFEQLRAAAASTCNGCSVAAELQSGSNGSARSIVTEENLDSGPTPEDLACLKTIVLANGSRGSNKTGPDDKGSGRVKAIAAPKKIFGKWLSGKGQGGGRGSGSDSTGSPELTKPEEHKFTPARNGRHSVS